VREHHERKRALALARKNSEAENNASIVLVAAELGAAPMSQTEIL
jgi:hypothetical protein